MTTLRWKTSSKTQVAPSLLSHTLTTVCIVLEYLEKQTEHKKRSILLNLMSTKYLESTTLLFQFQISQSHILPVLLSQMIYCSQICFTTIPKSITISCTTFHKRRLPTFIKSKWIVQGLTSHTNVSSIQMFTKFSPFIDKVKQLDYLLIKRITKLSKKSNGNR